MILDKNVCCNRIFYLPYSSASQQARVFIPGPFRIVFKISLAVNFIEYFGFKNWNGWLIETSITTASCFVGVVSFLGVVYFVGIGVVSYLGKRLEKSLLG